ncbi:hypothetical protein PAXINDRAFT_11421 [Paxillus involutus ATCC 200175]|uniref:Uncharacterized protein n=1 Tax=Paxillus involutus ATCC 200175 TaxID=664439 RepID=A0A0C9TZJ0_PAXIN|nr:hypothetical protein PAXINDRAFT_11421 [Paxillus involutus ATCC 200175]
MLARLEIPSSESSSPATTNIRPCYMASISGVGNQVKPRPNKSILSRRRARSPAPIEYREKGTRQRRHGPDDQQRRSSSHAEYQDDDGNDEEVHHACIVPQTPETEVVAERGPGESTTGQIADNVNLATPESSSNDDGGDEDVYHAYVAPTTTPPTPYHAIPPDEPPPPPPSTPLEGEKGGEQSIGRAGETYKDDDATWGEGERVETTE